MGRLTGDDGFDHAWGIGLTIYEACYKFQYIRYLSICGRILP
jgi:hypothetical protein